MTTRSAAAGSASAVASAAATVATMVLGVLLALPSGAATSFAATGDATSFVATGEAAAPPAGGVVAAAPPAEGVAAAAAPAEGVAAAAAPAPAGAAPSLPTADAASAFDAANAAFADGRYEEAARRFREVLEAHGPSPALLYDLANAELRAGRIGEAVLAYERARALAPRDPDVAANLRQTRRAADLPEPQPGAWERAAAWLTVDEWGWLATASLWAACVLAALRAVRAPEGARRRRGGVAIAVLAGLTVTAWALGWTRLATLERAVALGAEPALRVAPYASATISAELAPGQIVQVERGHEGFLLVRTDDGKAGWVSAEHAERILPVSKDTP